MAAVVSKRLAPAARAALLNDFACRAELTPWILSGSLAWGGQVRTVPGSPGLPTLYRSSPCFKEEEVLPAPFLPRPSAPSTSPSVKIFQL